MAKPPAVPAARLAIANRELEVKALGLEGMVFEAKGERIIKYRRLLASHTRRHGGKTSNERLL
jgi:hypothetical protein